jgi:hypothetical protein
MAKKSRRYIWQSVIGLGFLFGVWTSIGIDPEEVIITALGRAVDTIYPDPTLRLIFVILPTILLIASIAGAYKSGKIWGLVSVVVAYIAGLLIFSSLSTALVLLCGAIILGYLSTTRSLKRLAKLS